MKLPRGLFADRPLGVVYREEPEAALLPTQIRVRSEFASIKHGTEFTVFSGESPFHGKRFDGRLRLFVEDDPANPDNIAVRYLGNTVVGVVVERGADATQFQAGERVYGYAPACETVVMNENGARHLLEPMTAFDAVCIDPASVAYAAIRDAKICLGDDVIVFGMGAIGLFLTQMLRSAGCARILAVDPVARRRELAAALGATHTLDPAQGDMALEVRNILGAGADIAIEASGNYRALGQAMRCVAQCGRIVTLGYYHGKDTELELGAEWFHNRLELICSMPHWGNPLRDYPLWNEKRLVEAVHRMFLKQELKSEPLIEPIVTFEAAAEAFLALYHGSAQGIKMGIRFS